MILDGPCIEPHLLRIENMSWALDGRAVEGGEPCAISVCFSNASATAPSVLQTVNRPTAEAYYSRSLQYQADDASAWANRALAVTPVAGPGTVSPSPSGYTSGPRLETAWLGKVRVEDSLDVHKVRRGFEGFWDVWQDIHMIPGQTYVRMCVYIGIHTHTHTDQTDLVLPSYGLELFILKIVTSDRPAAELFLRQTHPDLRKKYLGIEAKHEVKACSYRIGTHALLWNLQITGTTSKEYSA